MKYIIYGILICSVIFTYGQVVRNTRLVDHTTYFLDVAQQTMREVEDWGWCNLKLPEISQNVSELVFTWPVSGSVTYKNGFLVSIQALDVIQQTIQQVWLYTAATNQTAVDVRGTMRLRNMALGYDVDAEINGENYHYTGVFTHPEVQFAYSIKKDLYTHDFDVQVTLSSLPLIRTLKMVYLPRNNITEVLSSQFDNNSTYTGVHDWAVNTFTPIARDVVLNKVPFPVICYNCPVS